MNLFLVGRSSAPAPALKICNDPVPVPPLKEQAASQSGIPG